MAIKSLMPFDHLLSIRQLLIYLGFCLLFDLMKFENLLKNFKSEEREDKKLHC